MRIATGGAVGVRDDGSVGATVLGTVGVEVGVEVEVAMFSMFIMKSLNRLKSMVPRPEAGSHPAVAWKPC